MTVLATRIRGSIKALLDGTTGSVRTVATTVFGYGTFEGQPIAAQQSRAIQQVTKAHRFDIKLGAIVPHASTPMSIKSSYRIARVPITIDILTTLKSTGQENERDTQRDAIADAADTAIQALSYPGNLLTAPATPTALATGIVSGLLLGPDGKGPPQWRVISEDWKAHLLRSAITASAIVVIDQATA